MQLYELQRRPYERIVGHLNKEERRLLLAEGWRVIRYPSFVKRNKMGIRRE